MKKEKIIFLGIVFLLSISLVLAETIIPEDTSNTSVSPEQSSSKIEGGFQCLEEKAKDCKDLTTQEIALTILATPENIFNDCLTELKSKISEDSIGGNIMDTALAILALNHAGEDTGRMEEWLINQSRTPTELVWYLEQDSNLASECNFQYSGEDHRVNIGLDKKLDQDAGGCLSRAQSSYWLKVSESCYNIEFKVSCDQDFITTFLYKNKVLPTIYVLEGTSSAIALESTKMKIKSKCFGESSCDYESTAWASAALLKTGHLIDDYIPYLVALADSNKRYLPEAFTYMVTNYEDYANQLISKQKLGNYWEATASANNRYYDTSLALIALGSSSLEQVTKSREWLLFTQESNGCWQNSVKDTAIVLWALTGRSGPSPGGSTTRCTDANYFCIPTDECPSSENVNNNYFCSGLSTVCCMGENLKTCSEYGGSVCEGDKKCSGNERRATDTDECCTATCEERKEEPECESDFFKTCKDSCSDDEEVLSYACNGGQVCCDKKPAKEPTKWWLWILIGIIILLAIIGWILREKLKLLLFKLKTKFKKDKGGRRPSRGGPRPPTRPGFPPRPGIPPRRPPMPVAPQRRKTGGGDKAMSETFRKLNEMSR